MHNNEDRVNIVTPSEVITSDSQYMRGHGTYLDENQSIAASLAGQVAKVNKLISVIPVKSRYTPEIGDVVVGRIIEVGSKRWKVDIRGRQHAALLLSSVNLPGGVQRRRLESDELQMRSFFSEGDLLVAEVQQIHHDHSVSLHTRSLKYGKLKQGLLLNVPSSLVRRSKSHFISLPFGIEVVLGVNGMIFVRVDEPELKMEELEKNPHLLYDYGTPKSISAAQRLLMMRVANCIRILCSGFVAIEESNILLAYEASQPYEESKLLDTEVLTGVLEIIRVQKADMLID